MQTVTAPYIVGLTGGIGSGKTAASDAFSALGAAVVDTDVIAHQLTGPGGDAMPAIIEEFGNTLRRADGGLDRTVMRQLVFHNVSARKRLEAILHPRIRAHSMALCAQAQSPYVILAVPLLLESGAYRERCQRICVLDCPEDMQAQRVMQRNGLSPQEVQAIMSAQASRQQRLAIADDVIDNSTTLEALQQQVLQLDARYRQMASAWQAVGPER